MEKMPTIKTNLVHASEGCNSDQMILSFINNDNLYRELNVTTYTTNKRRTISVDQEIYFRLKDLGVFGESFSELIARLLDLLKENRSHVAVGTTVCRS